MDACFQSMSVFSTCISVNNDTYNGDNYVFFSFSFFVIKGHLGYFSV